MKSRLWYFVMPIMAVFLGMVCSCENAGNSSEDEYASRMQTFVKDISLYARGEKPGFIIIPQNGSELAFGNAEPAEGILASYINAIDGIGIEELFYDGILNVDGERLSMLQNLKISEPALTIMVSDYVGDGTKISDAIERSRNEGFIAFPRSVDNYDYKLIPVDPPAGVNTDSISSLAAAKNYLYLISTEEYTNKAEMITAIAKTNFDVVLIDLFFDGSPITKTDIDTLKTKANGGSRLVICYISIGSAEKYRYYWKPEWERGNPSWIKKNYEGYPDEYWVEYWNEEWQAIIFGSDGSYIKQIINAGFDGVYLDNVEAYYFLN